MTWSQILSVLLQLVAENLPAVFAALVKWLQDKLAGGGGAEAMGPAQTGTLAEFKAAVRTRLTALAAGQKGLRKLLFTVLLNRVSDQILDRLYEIVTNKAASPAPTMGALDAETASLFDEMDAASL